MKNRKDPLGLSATRIQMIEANDKETETREQRRIRRERKSNALNLFMSKIQNATDRLEEIKGHLDDHLGYDPKGINYGHVGTAQHILDQLNDALTTIENIESK